jgi:hypothetical protein
MTIIRTLILLTGCATFVATAPAQQSGSISGLVADQSGAPVAGALVLYQGMPTLAPNATGGVVVTIPSASSGLTTGTDGTFAISGLPDGQYSVCAYAATAAQLGSCEWGAYSPLIEVTAGGAVNNVALQLTSGVLLTLLVSDPNSVIQETAPNTLVNGLLPLYGGNFRIGVMLGTIYARAQLASQQGTTRTYTVAVPQNVSLDLIADTSLLATAASGATVPNQQKGFSIPIGGSSAQVVNLTVQ